MQNEHMAGAILRIDLDALATNYHVIQRQVAPARVAGVIKADAYGLGAVPVAKALLQAGCRHFFVAHLGEAAALRRALPAGTPVFVLNGLHPGAEQECAAIGATPVLNSLDQIARWAECARRLGQSLPAALQFDSGMSRLGLPLQEVETLVAERSRLSGIDLTLLMSHLACADDPDALFNAQQRMSFQTVSRHFPGVPRSLDNSGGSFLDRCHFDVVRAGIGLYGGAPQKVGNPMRPVVSLEARIIQLRNVPAGAAVGYGLTHRCIRPTRIATIPVGYADGWPRHLSNKGSAFIAGQRVPIAGRVSMDSITLDVTDVPERLLYPDAAVELLGPHQSVDDVAADAGTISYEILTQLGRRYHRDYHAAPAAELQRSIRA
ncbi:alanine racemase [Sphingobium bisphenolivorans]|uniref:alanine racemase n=1 Tax=Sphingobium bisphenolivorans TaxID=1335760 RepID=UPI00039E435C|nr:alanine racemase [Sphingobium bisphenolivorans]